MKVELLKRELDAPLPEGQAQTFQLLLELAAENGYCTLADVVQRSNLRSALPLYSRLRHLEERGLIRTANPSASELPASVLLKA